MMGKPDFPPDIAREEVARQGGGDLAELACGQHKDAAMKVMAAGLKAVVSQLYADGKLDGILGMGGSGGTSIATTAMRALPVGVPKVMVSTMGGGDVSAYRRDQGHHLHPLDRGCGRHQQHQPGDLRQRRRARSRGMVKMEKPEAPTAEKPLIAASMFGNTTQCVDHARGVLEAAGYEVLVFHATGTGGRTMESLISDGYIVGLAGYHHHRAGR